MFYVFFILLSCGNVESKVSKPTVNRKADIPVEPQESDSSQFNRNPNLVNTTDAKTQNPNDLNNRINTMDQILTVKNVTSDRIFLSPQMDEYEIRNYDIDRLFPNVDETNLRDVSQYFYAKEEENWQNTKSLLKLPDFIRKTLDGFATENRQLVATWLLFNIIEIYLFANSKVYAFSSNDSNFTKECLDILVDEYGAQVNVVYHDGKERNYLLNRFINVHIKYNLELEMINKFLNEILKLKSRVPRFLIEDIVKKKDFRNPDINDLDITLLKYALDNQKNDFKDNLPELIQLSLNGINQGKGLEAFKLLFDAMLELNSDLNNIILKGYAHPAQSLFFQIIYKYLDNPFSRQSFENYLEALRYVLPKYDWDIFIYDGEDKTSYHTVFVEISYILCEVHIPVTRDIYNDLDKLMEIMFSNDHIKKTLIKDNNHVIHKGVTVFGTFKEFIDNMLSANPKITIKKRVRLIQENEKYYKQFSDKHKEYLRKLYESYNKYVSGNR